MSARIRIPLALCAGLLLLVVAELLLRALGFGGGAPEPFDFASWQGRSDRPGMFTTHPERFFTLAPDYRFSVTHAGRYPTGDWPFRGRPPEPAPDGILRVGVFGDSCAHGLTLFASESIPQRIAAHLADAGLDPTEVQVLNFGVPGYSTVQIRALLEEALTACPLDAVVLYPAAWNDQAPALGKDDVELRETVRHPSLARRLRSTGLGDALDRLVPRGAPAAPESQHPRVPAEAVGTELAAMLARCTDVGVPAVVIVPPHPVGTEATHARLVRDAETVRRVATERGARIVDGPELFAAEPARATLMTDIAHPSPPGADLLAGHAARALLRAGLPEPRGAAPLEVRLLVGEETPSMGDVVVEVSIDSWSPDDGLPAVLLGGVLLLDLRPLGEGRFAGLLPADAPGAVDVVVQTRRGVGRVRRGATRIAPILIGDAGSRDAGLGDGHGDQPDSALALASRPGDRAQVWFAGRPRPHPLHTEHGAILLEQADLLPVALEVVAGAGYVDLPPLQEGEFGPVWAQGRVLPPGEPDDSKAAFLTPLVQLRK